MAKCYFELRTQGARGTDSMAADIMRHLHTRQHLGKAVILCDSHDSLLGPSRRQWLKLGRAIQKQRAATLNADKILKYTHTITRMQHMRFTHKNPLDDPEAEVHFLTMETCHTLPVQCYTVYVALPLKVDDAARLLLQLPAEALLVDYYHRSHWERLGLQPKLVLESHVQREWQQVRQYLASNNVDPGILLHRDGLHNIEAMDDALDTLLNVSHGFMRIANEFQRALELSRPLRVPRDLRDQYDMVVLLAHRVQALSPGAFTQHFLESYNEDDTFFLHDRGKFYVFGEPLAVAVARHLAAGRPTLARALRETASRQAYMGLSLSPKK